MITTINGKERNTTSMRLIDTWSAKGPANMSGANTLLKDQDGEFFLMERYYTAFPIEHTIKSLRNVKGDELQALIEYRKLMNANF